VTTLLLSALADFVAAPEDRVDGDVRSDAGSPAAYSTDASNLRHVPLAVIHDLAELLAWPILARSLSEGAPHGHHGR
jgi:hypothetical protein